MSRTADITEWYADQYAKAVGIAHIEGGERFKRLTKNFPVASKLDNDTPFPSTGKQRMENFLSLKLRYPLGPSGYSCLAMSATIGRKTAHFAYAYWRRGSESEPPEYICVSPTFDSRDGEYRRRFIRGPVFLDTYEKLASELTPFEEAVVAMLSGPLELKSSAYPESAAAAMTSRAPAEMPHVATPTVTRFPESSFAPFSTSTYSDSFFILSEIPLIFSQLSL